MAKMEHYLGKMTVRNYRKWFYSIYYSWIYDGKFTEQDYLKWLKEVVVWLR